MLTKEQWDSLRKGITQTKVMSNHYLNTLSEKTETCRKFIDTVDQIWDYMAEHDDHPEQLDKNSLQPLLDKLQTLDDCISKIRGDVQNRNNDLDNDIEKPVEAYPYAGLINNALFDEIIKPIADKTKEFREIVAAEPEREAESVPERAEKKPEAQPEKDTVDIGIPEFKPAEKEKSLREAFGDMKSKIEDCDPFYIRSSDEFRNAKKSIEEVMKLTKDNGVNYANAGVVGAKMQDALDYTLLYIEKKSKESNRSELAEKRLAAMKEIAVSLDKQYRKFKEDRLEEVVDNKTARDKLMQAANVRLKDPKATKEQKLEAKAMKAVAEKIPENEGYFIRQKFLKQVAEKKKELGTPSKTQSAKAKENPDINI